MSDVSNPVLDLFFNPDINKIYQQRDEAVKAMMDKFQLSRALMACVELNGRLEAIGIVLLGWCSIDELAAKASSQMRTGAERSSFSVLNDYFRKAIKNIYSSKKLISNPLAPSVTREVARDMIVTHLSAEMILEYLFLHVALFGATSEPESEPGTEVGAGPGVRSADSC